jgi:adenylosuccinate synthase
MPAVVVVGAQWGDEGKGKATDLLGDRVDYVVRYQGGNNAGHTVVIGDESYALHLLPSGVLSPNVVPVIGNGVVIDPQVLLDEIDGLAARGVDCAKLLVSANAHLITPYHRALDKVTERYLGSARIGTTGRGIGPAYGGKIARTGIRVQDLFDPGILRQKLDLVLREKNQMLTKVYNRRGIEAEAIAADYEQYAERLRPYVADTALALGRALDQGQVVLLEGAQATMLDVDHGTYPFVTSSPRGWAAWGLRSADRSPTSSASSRRTRPGSARGPSPPSCATTPANGCARPVPSTASPPAGRAAAAGSTRSSPGTRPG